MHFCTQYFSTNNCKTVLWSLQSFKNTSKLTEKHFAIAWHCLSGLAKQRTVHDMQEKANHTFINTLLTNTISYAYNKTGNTHIIAVHTFHHPSSWINYAKPKKTSPINPKQRREHQRLHGPNWTLFTNVERGAGHKLQQNKAHPQMFRCWPPRYFEGRRPDGQGPSEWRPSPSPGPPKAPWSI